MPKKIQTPLFTALSLLFWLGLWWVAAVAFHKPLLLPTPRIVLETLWSLARTALFWKTVATSLLRILLGILAALVTGTLLAVLTVWSRFFHHLFSPLLNLFKATPVASVIFLMLLFIGRARVPFVIAFMMALPIVWSNVREGLLATDRSLLEMATVFRLSPWKKLTRIRLPALLPYFLAAARSAIGLSWKAGVAAEVLCVPEHSIGRAIFEGKQYLMTEDLFAWTLTVILISVAVEALALALLRLGDKERRKATC